MKRLNICYLFIVVILGTLTACQQDDNENSATYKGSANVTLRITTAEEANTTRAWNDDNAETDRSEMMYNWTVLVVNSSNQIAYKYTNDDADGVVAADNAEIDVVCQNVSMASGTYTVYSFANISEASLQTILGVSSLEPGTALSDVDQKTVTINANLKQEADITADNAFGLGSKGIPMSNRQTLTVNGTVEKDLIVVRMVAKLEFVFFNATGAELNVKSVTISDITQGTTGNLMLMPKYADEVNADKMTFVHKDLRPHLNNSDNNANFKVDNVTYTKTLILGVNDTYDISKLQPASDYEKKFTFYINESDKPKNADHLFFITVELDNDDYRYALVSTGTDAGLTVTKDPNYVYPDGNNEALTTTEVSDTKISDDWDYIARNDYRVIPIVLDDYKLEIIPYDFPAIGVYPASVSVTNPSARISERIYQIDFHDYGHFHLVPKVTHAKGTEAVDFTRTALTPTFSVDAEEGKARAKWGLISDAWGNSFKSYTDETATTEYTPNVNRGAASDEALNGTYSKTQYFFYGAPDATGAATYPAALPIYGTNFDGEVTHTVGDKTYSQGDFPMLDTETKWDPKGGENYLPYIFGQIAPQEDNADKKTYHELRAYVYVNGESVPRLLIYRFYMHLKQDFGLARRYAAARPTCRLHCHE